MSRTRETTYTGILGGWQRALKTFAANAADLAHLEASRLKLETIFQKAQDIAQQQAALTASRQDLSQQLKTLIQEGQRALAVLRVSVKDHYGPRSEKLAEFSIQPFRGRKSKQEPELVLKAPDSVAPTASR
jgi:uncharacterized membrane protein YgcG